MRTADQALPVAPGMAHPWHGATGTAATTPMAGTDGGAGRPEAVVGAAAPTWWPAVRVLLILGDTVAVAVALALAVLVSTVLSRTGTGGPVIGGLQGTAARQELLALLLAWLPVIAASGGYTPRVLGTGAEEYKRVIQGTLKVFGAVAVVGYAIGLAEGRAVVATALVAGLVLLPVGRYTTRRAVVAARQRGRWQHRVVVVGDREQVQSLVTRLHTDTFAGFAPVAACLGSGSRRRLTPGVPVLGSWDQVASVVRQVEADTVVVAGGQSATPERIRRTAWSLEPDGADLVVSTSLTDVTGPRISVRPVAGLPLLYVDQPRLTGIRRAVKAALDALGAVTGLTLLCPLLLVTAAVVRLTSPGPALFRQVRIGQDGREFRVFKFRTMYTDAEERLAELVDRNESDGLLFKIKEDPRITPVGRVLRATSIDELPQLLNVLLGQMSLVGPRPLPVKDSDFTGHVRRRLLVRPGITGLWQVSGRSDISWEESVRLDLTYVENWSLSLDLLILARTVAAIVRRRGAY